jgi:outer membrane protein W
MKTIGHCIFSIVPMITIIVISGQFSYSSDAKQPSLGFGSTTPPPVETQLLAPESLTLKYKPDASKTFKPFLGTGLAFSTKTQETNIETKQEIKAGVGASAGLDVKLGKDTSLKVDYKYLYLAPDVKNVHDGSTPQQIGIGFDMKF